LLDVEHYALLENRIPILGFELAGRNYIILTEEDYIEMRL